MIRPTLTLGNEASGWDDDFDAGPVKHILPAASHRRLLVKTSFHSALRSPPVLQVNGRDTDGVVGDLAGRFWSFEASGLDPDTEHTLQLLSADRKPFTQPWPLRTLPDPDARRDHVRLLVYTCAGGLPDAVLPNGKQQSLPVDVRRRLLARGLSFRPDAVIANGDHVYWDQRSVFEHLGERMRALVESVYAPYGSLDRNIPVLGSNNERVLTGVVDRQIAELYGTRLRSTPVWFLADDHDYFENDTASPELITFPPDRFMVELARATQHLYYPEFLADPAYPRGLPGTNAPDRRSLLSETYGVLRYGDLLEVLLYNTRRDATLRGSEAVFVDPLAEAWIRQRTADESRVRQLIHAPSHPFGWTAGKWMEWYPDHFAAAGSASGAGKPYWQAGWLAQHQRLLGQLAAQRQRPAFTVSGDLHVVAAGVLRRSGALEFSANPVTTLASGPIGTGDLGWPSVARGTVPVPADSVDMQTLVEPTERNGFTVLDVGRERIDVRMFAWRPPEPVAAIDRLPPIAEFSVARLS